MSQDTQPTDADPENKADQPGVLHGTSVAPGVAMGRAFRKDYDLSQVTLQRVPRDHVERELNRFHSSLTDSRDQLEELKGHLRGNVPEDHVRVLDTHVAYLRDSVFLSDVENLILNEQMCLEGAIAKVILDFDRIFRLVQSETLRERAVDLRDVGIRVLRNLEGGEGPEERPQRPKGDYILVAGELSIVDMFSVDNQHVLGILTEGGSLTSHGAILARSMRIPTLTGVEGLLDEVREGDFLIVDGTEGVVRVRPDEFVREQYSSGTDPDDSEGAEGAAGEAPEWADFPGHTRGGESIQIAATCGTLPEVERSALLGMAGVGLYRTELLYLIDREPPSIEALSAHYKSVIKRAEGGSVTFRLLDADSNLQLGYLHEERELNPGLGRMGIRALLANTEVLRFQVRAMLRASADTDVVVRIAVPKVVDCDELRRVKEVLFAERHALRKAGTPFGEDLKVGAVLETPTSILGIRDLAGESDFLVINFNSLHQYLLAADRENALVAGYFAQLHPYVIRTLRKIVEVCAEAQKPLSIFGATAVSTVNLPLLLGVGLRHFSVAPVAVKAFLESIAKIDLREATRLAEEAARAVTSSELDPVMRSFGDGYGS
ncbi:MAG: phosphoenolpyruvate-protein phosphotransferase [Chlamydiales bacterium]|jgi:phosphoenolpyruvate-protein phosphotransferase